MPDYGADDYGLDEEPEPEPEPVKKVEKPKPKKTVHLAVQEEDKQVSFYLSIFSISLQFSTSMAFPELLRYQIYTQVPTVNFSNIGYLEIPTLLFS